jgi:ATP-dependent RNA helicase DeaD
VISNERTPDRIGGPQLHSADEVPDAPATPNDGEGSFDDLGLSPLLCEAIRKAGWTTPSRIQMLGVPPACAGKDVVGQSRTGTGKTGAFVLPMLHRLLAEDSGKQVRALVITPTRELALQVKGEADRLGGSLGIESVTIYGGQAYGPQLDALRRGVPLVVGTPGRLIDHIQKRTLDLSGLWFLVLDEFDRMLDMGFRDDIDRIVRRTPRERQTLLFSATVPPEVMRLANKYLHEPEEVMLAPDKLTVDEVDQSYIAVDKNRKTSLLVEFLKREDPPMTVVFARTRATVKSLAPRLTKAGFDAKELHGDLDQRRRETVLERFREKRVKVLVATDVAARGLDVSGISHIVNYDVPEDPEDYVHRIGRTARMGQRGIAVTFVTPDQGDNLTAIEQLINREIPCDRLDDFVAVQPKEAEPEAPRKKVSWNASSGSSRRRRRRRR